METKLKNTILIAEFMGEEIVPYQGFEYNPIYNGNKYAKTIGEHRALWGGLDIQFIGRFTNRVIYPFDTDFRYLLPVIKRIEEMGYVVCIDGIRYKIYEMFKKKNPIISLVCGDLSKKTQMTFNAIISFIEWYNQNKSS